jgi:hypothetical protein
VKACVLALALSLVVSSQRIEAKCASKRFHVILSAYDGETNLGVPGATLTLFANAETEAWLPDYGSGAPVITDANGSFSGTFWFNPSSGSFFGLDSCRAKLKHIQVVASHPGYRSARVTAKASTATTSSTSNEVTLRIPAIALLPIK